MSKKGIRAGQREYGLVSREASWGSGCPARGTRTLAVHRSGRNGPPEVKVGGSRIRALGRTSKGQEGGREEPDRGFPAGATRKVSPISCLLSDVRRTKILAT